MSTKRDLAALVTAVCVRICAVLPKGHIGMRSSRRPREEVGLPCRLWTIRFGGRSRLCFVQCLSPITPDR